MSQLEDLLLFQIKAAKLPIPEREYKFYKTRRWRFDFAWPDKMLACECDGGHWVNGRHNRGSGVDADCEKYAHALMDGWRVLRVTGTHVKNGEALSWIEKLLS